MRDKLKKLTNEQLILLANELNESIVPSNALIRTLLPEGTLPVLGFIEINAHLTQVLADRLADNIFYTR